MIFPILILTSMRKKTTKKTKRKRRKRYAEEMVSGVVFVFSPAFFLLLILETPERQDHNYKVFHFIEVLHKT